MSRPFARLKLGYYPLPTEEARNIHSLLVASGPYCAIDPCAGDGTVLLEITTATGAHPAAIEIDTDRAAGCIQRGITTIHGSAFECKVQSESCSLLYLNPPYDTELGPHHNRRMELVFLEHCYRWVKTDGVLVFVIPVAALNSCARLLASQFDRVKLFRLEHPECVRFHQIVVFGTRKKSHGRGEPRGIDALLRAGYRPSLIPALKPDLAERYFIPASPPITIHYSGLPLDQIEDGIERSVAMQNACGVLVRKQQRMSGRPVTPLHKGHVGLLACSGMLNGFFGEGDDRHIAHWRAVKHVDEFNEEGEEIGETIVRRRERFSHELTLAFENGRILELKETKNEDQKPKFAGRSIRSGGYGALILRSARLATTFRQIPTHLAKREVCYNSYTSYNTCRGDFMGTTRSVVISMRLPAESGSRLKRMATRHGWTPSDASARLVEEGLRRSEFAFIDFRDSAAGRQAYVQGSTLAVWEVLLLVRSYKEDVAAVAKHLQWPQAKVQGAINYAEAFPEEIEEALSENAATDFNALKRMLPQARKHDSRRVRKSRDAQASAR